MCNKREIYCTVQDDIEVILLFIRYNTFACSRLSTCGVLVRLLPYYCYTSKVQLTNVNFVDSLWCIDMVITIVTYNFNISAYDKCIILEFQLLSVVQVYVFPQSGHLLNRPLIHV
jgi:hypothetical protein